VTQASEARELFVAAGYNPAHVRNNYVFTCRDAEGSLANKSVLLAAFGASPFNVRTSCFTFDRFDSTEELDALFDRLRFLAAPLAILRSAERTELWSIRREQPPIRIKEAVNSNWTATFAPLLREFSPSAVLAAKSGQRQLDFIDSGLTSWAERITEQTLVYLLENLLSEAPAFLPTRQSRTPDAKLALLRLVFHLFACRVLEDKGVIPAGVDIAHSLALAHARFSNNIDPNVLASPALNQATITFVERQLRGRFAFASLTTEMLGYAYENALVTANLRRERGIFYTPRAVTNQILSRLPIESIEQQNRLLLDPCCGSGSFLLAGFERLNSLLPDGWSPAKRHQYLRARLLGSDIDDFAIEVAALSLVVTDPNNRNGWQLTHQEVSTLSRDDFKVRPSIIVSNPPFRELKTGGSRRELASEILLQIIDLLAPGGLLGVIVPQSMLDSRAGSGSRAALLEHCDIIEIDTLPGGLFESAAETAVLMARKRDGSSGRNRRTAPVTVRELRAKDLPKFRTAKAYTATYSVDSSRWRVDPQNRFIISPFADLWQRLEQSHARLGSVAGVRAGIQLKPDDKTSVSGTKRSGDVPFVDRPDILRPFALLLNPLSAKWLRYGDQLHRARDISIFEHSKAIMNSNRKPGSVWRLIAAPAQAGLYFSENFHGVIPKDGKTSIELLLAVLNSAVANAWFDAHCKKRKVVQSILEELPYPVFQPYQVAELEAAVRKLEREVVGKWRSAEEGLFYDGLLETFDSANLLDKIDTLVCEAYGLTTDEVRNVNKYMGAEKRPG